VDTTPTESLYFNLPKRNKQGIPVISYSQVALWLRSKKDYIREYFFNDKEKLEVYLDFGSKVGEALENNDYKAFSDKEKETLIKVPRLDIFEKFIEIPFSKFRFIGYIDSISEDGSYLIDYKTGAEDKKEEYLKENYLQMKLYAAAIRFEKGVLPVKTEVILIERLGNPFRGDKLTVGDGVWTLPQDITEDTVQEALNKVETAAEEISNYYTVFQKLNR